MPSRKPASERFERLLARPEAVPHQQSRDDATTQQRHDVITARMVHALERKSAAARLERQRVDRHLATRLQRVMGPVVDVEAVVQQQLYDYDDPPSARQTTTTTKGHASPLTGRSSGTHSSRMRDGSSVKRDTSRMKMRQKASRALLPSPRAGRMNSGGVYNGQDNAVAQSTRTAAPTQGRTTSTSTALVVPYTAAQPVTSQQRTSSETGEKNAETTLCTAYYTLGFPTAFEHSGFHSLTRWADVSFQETIMAAFGPRAPHTRLREGPMPHRLLVTVACYLLNEVLSREPTLSALWSLLRQSIFDAVFSPRLIEAERGDPLTYHNITTIMTPHSARQEGAGSFVSSLPPQQRPQTAAWLVREAADRQACMPALPPHAVDYESLEDYARYALWTEEVTSVTKQNAYLAERVEALKQIVRRSGLVLHMVQRRADTMWKRRVFLLWRNYSRRAHAARKAATTYLVHRRQRVLEDICFLRWRRITLQSKIDALQKERARLDQETQRSVQAHKLAMAGLRHELEKEQETRQVIEVQHAAAQAQLHESHRLESQALNYALTRQLRRGEALTKCLRRWERMAKTFRPVTLCSRPPRALLVAGTELRQLEDELAWMRKESHARLLRHRQVSVMFEKFVLLWVNQVMRHEPERGRTWIEVTRLERTRDTVTGANASSHNRSRRRLNNNNNIDDYDDSEYHGRNGVTGYGSGGTRRGDAARDRAGVFTYDTLHRLVLELQRLYTSAAESTKANSRNETSDKIGGGAGRVTTPPLHANAPQEATKGVRQTSAGQTRRASPRAVTLVGNADDDNTHPKANTLIGSNELEDGRVTTPPTNTNTTTAGGRPGSASHTPRAIHHHQHSTHETRHRKGNHSSDSPLLLSSEGSETLFHALCTVLYLQTDEGLSPSLLAHCPYLRHFLHPATFTTPMPRVGMLWLLCALFIGYVQRCCGAAAFLPAMWPASLQCQQELSVAGRVSSAITIHGPEVDLPMTAAMVQAVTRHVMPTQHARRRSVSRRSTHGSQAPQRHGSPTQKVLPSHTAQRPSPTTVTHHSPNALNDSMTNTTTNITGPALAMPNATFAPIRPDSRHNSLPSGGPQRRHQGSVSLISASGVPRRRPRTKRGLQLCDVDLVCDGVDTVSDMEVYLGIKDEYFPHEYCNDDVDALLKDAASAETRAIKHKLRHRRQQRRSQHQQSNSQSGNDGNEQAGRIRSANSNCSGSSCSSFSQRTSSSSSSSSGSTGRSRSNSTSSVSMSRNGEDEDEMTSEMAESMRETKGALPALNNKTLEEQQQQEGDGGTLASLGTAAQADSPVSSPTQKTLTVRQTRLLAQLLAPSRAFDVVRHRHHRNNNTNGNNVMNAGEEEEEDDEDEDDEVRRERERKVRRVALHTFVQRIILDAQRRRQWLGLARVLQSLILRFRVLDYGVPNAWMRLRAGGNANANPTGGNATGGGIGGPAMQGYTPFDLPLEPTPHMDILLTEHHNTTMNSGGGGGDCMGGNAAGHRERLGGRLAMTPPESTLSRPNSGYAPSGRATRVVVACDEDNNDDDGVCSTRKTPSAASMLSPAMTSVASERPQSQPRTPPSHQITGLLHSTRTTTTTTSSNKSGSQMAEDTTHPASEQDMNIQTNNNTAARHTPLPSIVVPPTMLSSAITPSPASTQPTSPSSQRAQRVSPRPSPGGLCPSFSSHTSAEDRPLVQARFGPCSIVRSPMRHLSLTASAEGDHTRRSKEYDQQVEEDNVRSRQTSMTQGVAQSWPAHPLGALVIQPPPGARALTQQQQQAQQQQHRYRFNLKDVHRHDHM